MEQVHPPADVLAPLTTTRTATGLTLRSTEDLAAAGMLRLKRSSPVRPRFGAVTPPTLGTLDWQPALDHPELLAPAVVAGLAELDLGCFVAPIDPALADTAAFCEAHAVPLDASANCVVVEGRRGETTTLAACLVLATDRADVNRSVRKHLDVRKISFASMDRAVSATGMAYGGITPIGLPADWPLLVDDAVAAQPWVVVGSGIRGSKILCPGPAIGALPNVQVLTLRQPPLSGAG